MKRIMNLGELALNFPKKIIVGSNDFSSYIIDME
jgi:hypothetical protein